MTTESTRKEDVKRKWYVVDLEDRVLGRAATRIASMLRGKHKPEFTPHVDTGDHIIVINAEKVKLTGNKWEGKMYHHHTMHPGGLVSRTARKLNERHPGALVEEAVRRMIPRSPLGRQVMKKLHVYAGNEHPHAAQKPEPLAL